MGWREWGCGEWDQDWGERMRMRGVAYDWGERGWRIGKAGENAYFCKIEMLMTTMKILLTLVAAMLPCLWVAAQVSTYSAQMELRPSCADQSATPLASRPATQAGTQQAVTLTSQSAGEKEKLADQSATPLASRLATQAGTQQAVQMTSQSAAEKEKPADQSATPLASHPATHPATHAATHLASQQQEDLDAQYAGTLLKPGTEAPAFTLKDIRGKEVSLSQFRGRKVVLLFWASWCPDCRAEIPALKALHAAAQPDKVAFVSVSFDRSFDTLCQFVEENYLPGVQLFDPAGKKDSPIGEQYGIKWIPSLYVIDEAGKVQLGTVVLDKVTATLRESNVLSGRDAGMPGQGLTQAGRELCTDESCAL